MRPISKRIAWLCLLLMLWSAIAFAAHHHSDGDESAKCSVCVAALSASPTAPALPTRTIFLAVSTVRTGAGCCRQTAPDRLRTHGSPASASSRFRRNRQFGFEFILQPRSFPEEIHAGFMQEVACRGFAGCSLSGARSERVCASQEIQHRSQAWWWTRPARWSPMPRSKFRTRSAAIFESVTDR